MAPPLQHKPGFTLDFTSSEEQDRMSASVAAPGDPYTTATHTSHSYLTHKSAPTTPSILSHHIPNPRPTTSGSTKPRHRNQPLADIPRSRSSAHLPIPTPQANTARARRLHKSALQLHANDSEWLFRAGATIANDVEDSKGQGWLSQRASSTSLVGLDAGDEDNAVVTPWEVRRRRLELDARSRSRVASARTSRVPSRVQSARASRRNSGVGLQGLAMTGSQGLEVEEDDYFGGKVEYPQDDDANELEGDVEALHHVEDEGLDADDDEDELARMTKERSFGLGSFVDRLMAWTIFSPSNENEDHEGRSERGKDDMLDTSRASTKVSDDHQEDTPAADGAGWKDMIWLFGVAVTVLF